MQREATARKLRARQLRVALLAMGPRRRRCLRPLRPVVGLLAAGLLSVGCMSSQVRGAGEAAVALGPEEAVAILLHHHSRQSTTEAHAVEAEIVGCLSRPLRATHPNLRIVSPEEFRRTTFPDLAPDAAPRSPRYLLLLLHHPTFRERITPLNLRYLIVVGGRTDQEMGGGCVSGPGAGACIVLWERNSQFGAVVLDLKEGRSPEEIQVSVEGTAWLFLPFPIGLPAPTESRACEDLGQRIAQFLSSEDGGIPR